MGKLIPHSLRIAYLNLQRNGRRSLLSVLIVAIAVFALTSAGGFGLYTYDSLKESTARDTGHLTLSQPGFFEQDEEMPLANGLANTENIVKQLLVNQNVRGVQPRIEFTGLVSNGTKSTIFVGTGVNDREFDMKGPFLDVRKGKTLSNTQSPRYDATEPEVMLAVDLAKNLNVTTNDWVTLLATTSDGALNAFDFKVRGIYSTGVPELDKRQLYLHIESAQGLLDSHKISTLSVFLYGTDQTANTQGWVEEQLNDMNLEQAIEVTPWEERAFFYKRVKDLYDRIFGIMGAVMAMVVFVALFNTMTMSVTERTREIGTLSALGTYPNEIVSGFVREAGLLAILGALMGGVMTLATSLILLVAEVQMPPPPGQTDGYPLNIYFSAELLAYCAAGVMIICVGAAWVSARKGVKKPITEALVYV
ncbi:ABC transporter permease [Vibrio sp. YMD68]|uniref:ABC transporter permease n=1 Tax=Vibrio sp. YMD68 TaxID=3042300 RepID=UPI00249A35C3|nr:FtsX-like permease family protein [Vibrio sp. YMD68]WGV98728.1 ABC transporter permease [Vibrio sp. YMD68]